MRLWSAILLLCFWTGPAHAAGVHLVVGEHTEKTAAEAEAALLQAAGHQGRIIRRFVIGKGWRYQVRLGDFESDAAAEALAKTLPVTGEVRIVGGQGRTRTVATGGGVPSKPASPPATVAAPADENGFPAAKSLVRSAIKASGGKSGAIRRVLGEDYLRFAFRSRAVVSGDEVVAEHVYYRSPAGIRLEVDVIRGKGVSNVVVITVEPRSWVATDKEVVERDWIQANDLVSHFAPETGVLSIPLGLPKDAVEATEWRELVTDAKEDLYGQAHYRVVPSGKGSDTALVAAYFDAASHLLSRVTWRTRGGNVTFDYRDYKSVTEGVVIPHRVRVERDGQLVQEVEVSELVLGLELRNELFTQPAVLRRRR